MKPIQYIWGAGSLLVLSLTIHCTADLAQGDPCYAIASAACNYVNKCWPSSAEATSCQQVTKDPGTFNNANVAGCDVAGGDARSCASAFDSQSCGGSSSPSFAMPQQCPTGASSFLGAIGSSGGSGSSSGSDSSSGSGSSSGTSSSGGVSGGGTGGGSTSGGSTGSCQTVSDCPPAQYAGVSQVECVGGICTYPGAFCNAGTSVCGTDCVCPANSQNSGQGCVCNSGYQLELCNGTPCTGSACNPNFKCGPVGGSGSSSGGSGSVCYQSTSVSLCSCASAQNIASCSINANYGSMAASCSGLDCCLTDQGGTCCDCAASSYLSTLGLTCASWIAQSGGTRVSSCP